ncbi:MAG: NAD(P)/FAD-dependent oxidoreductase [Polyangiaceae bacterium]
MDRFRKLDQDQFDVIVIGAGTGGLTAAALLAKRGKSVLIVDQHYVAGGNATIFKRPGYEFDVGLHYVGQCERGLFRASSLARRCPGEVPPDGPRHRRSAGLRARDPRGLERYRLRLTGAFPSNARHRPLRLVSGSAGRDRSDRVRRSGRALFRSPLVLRFGNGTLGAFLDTCTRDPMLRTVLAAESGDYAEPPSRAALVLHAGLMLHYLDEGGYYPEGGGQVMSDRLAEAIEKHGGKILLSTRVERILLRDGRAVGVRLRNKHIGVRDVAARAVVSNADIKRLYLELIGPEHVRKKTVRKVRAWEMAPALGMVYLGVRREALGARLRNTNYWIYGTTDVEGAYRDVRAGRFSREPLLYVSIASLKDPGNPKVAPPGIVNLQLMSLAPHQPEAWGVSAADVANGTYSDQATYRERKAEYTAALFRAAERVFPGLEKHVVFQETATPLTHTRYTLSTGGTSYGLALVPEQFLWRRPGPKTEIDSLYVCGASTYTGHGIAGAMASGVNAAAALVGREVWREVWSALPSTAREAARRDAPAESPAPSATI